MHCFRQQVQILKVLGLLTLFTPISWIQQVALKKSNWDLGNLFHLGKLINGNGCHFFLKFSVVHAIVMS